MPVTLIAKIMPQNNAFTGLVDANQIIGTSTLTMDGSHTVTGLSTPTNSSDAATKAYVDAALGGLTLKSSARVATTANLSATYSNGTSGVGATLTNSSTQAAISIDGVSLSMGDSVLVKNQSTASQNGCYTVTTVGTVSTNWVLTRRTDYDQATEVAEGTAFIIEEGTANAATMYVETGQGPFTIGTTAITFTQIGGGGGITALTGDVTASGTGSVAATIAALAVTTGKINTNAVTYAKMQQASSMTVLGNSTGSTANVAEISLPLAIALGGSGGSTAPYDIIGFWPGQLLGSSYVPSTVFFEMTMARTVVFPASLTGSYFACDAGTEATSNNTLTLNKNGSSIGTVVFSSGSQAGAITFASQVTFSAGDVFSITNQSTADATLGNVSFTIKATRSN